MAYITIIYNMNLDVQKHYTDHTDAINTFTSKRDCSRINRSLPNVTKVEI